MPVEIKAPTADTSTPRFPVDNEEISFKILVKYVFDSLDPDSFVLRGSVSISPISIPGPTLSTASILRTSFSWTRSLTFFVNT